MKTKVSDLVANFFFERNVTHGFGIIGSANSHLFDSFFKPEFNITLICNHHEQACTMAVQTFWKIKGIPSFALVTAGAGSSNAITGVLSAWADSIPCIILSGQENTRYLKVTPPLRMYGIQGYDSTYAVSKITKYSSQITDPRKIIYELEKAWYFATTGRPGPCWLDIPMDVQSMQIEDQEIEHFIPPQLTPDINLEKEIYLNEETDKTLALIRKARRPLLWLGVGLTSSGVRNDIARCINSLGIPTLLSWSAIDLVQSNHKLIFGRAGTYGQRSANLILQNADYILAIGTRLAIPQVGYEITELARSALEISLVDIDENELSKYPSRITQKIHADAWQYLNKLSNSLNIPIINQDWVSRCCDIRDRYPWVSIEHTDKNGFINSYEFMRRLSIHLKPNQIIVTDMGTALLSGHQALSLNQGQRLLTSQGLGEMGFGLPGAIGASIASRNSDVICLNCDGGMMMNLQELQTIVHHQLPIKIFIFNNDGYLMIKHTQKAILDGRYVGTNKATGVSCPNYSKIATAFEIKSWQIRTWSEFEFEIPHIQIYDKPCIVEVFIHPEQLFVPKLSVARATDGRLVSPPLEDLSPLLPRDVLRHEMYGSLHPKSENLY